MANTRRENGKGSVKRLQNGNYEAIVQSSLVNPKTLKPKRFKATAGTSKEALEKAILKKEAFEKGILYQDDFKVDKKKMLGQYMYEFVDSLRGSITESTFYDYIKTLRYLFDKYPISTLQLQMLNKPTFESYFNELQEKYELETVKQIYGLLKRLLDDLVVKSLVKENYVKQITLKKQIKDEYKVENDETKIKKIFTKEDLQKFYDEYKNTESEISLITIFLLETGIRCGEFCALENKEIHLEERYMIINKNLSDRIDDESGKRVNYIKTTKNSKERYVPLSNLACEVIIKIREQVKEKGIESPYLFPSLRQGKGFGLVRKRESIEGCFKNLCKKLDIDTCPHKTKAGRIRQLNVHSLRHTMNSYSKQINNNSNSLLMVLGHQSEKINQIYTHMNEDLVSLMNLKTPFSMLEEETKEDLDLGLTEQQEQELLRKLLKKYMNNDSN